MIKAYILYLVDMVICFTSTVVLGSISILSSLTEVCQFITAVAGAVVGIISIVVAVKKYKTDFHKKTKRR